MVGRVVIDTDLMYVSNSKHETWKSRCRLLLLYKSLVNSITTVAGIVGSQRIMA